MIDCIVALAWIPIALILHSMMHEMSHWWVARKHGISGKIKAIPARLPDGRFVWGYTLLDSPLPEDAKPVYYSAPVLTELAWFVLMCVAVNFVDSKILLVELGASVLDVATWSLGAWTMRSGCDAEQFITSTGSHKWSIRMGGSLLVTAMATTGVIVYLP